MGKALIKSTILPWLPLTAVGQFVYSKQNLLCQICYSVSIKVYFFCMCVRQTHTLSPTLCICPSSSGPRVWCAWGLPGSPLFSQFPAGWQAWQCLLWRRIPMRLQCFIQGHLTENIALVGVNLMCFTSKKKYLKAWQLKSISQKSKMRPSGILV